MSVPDGDAVSLRSRSGSSETRTPLYNDDYLIEGVRGALEVLEGKWKIHLLFYMARGVHRHSRLLECLPGASKKVMTDSLRALERDGLVARQIFAEVPVRVEYSLTPLGWTLAEPLVSLSQWGEEYASDVAQSRLQPQNRHAPEPGEPRIAQRIAAA